MRFPDLSPVLHSVQWAMIGAGATRLYMPERATQDMDVIVDVADAKAARRLLSEAGGVQLSGRIGHWRFLLAV